MSLPTPTEHLPAINGIKTQRPLWTPLFAFIGAAAIIAVCIVLGVQSSKLQREVTASCNWYRAYFSTPLKPTPPATIVSQRSATLSVDAWSAYVHGGCPMPPPPLGAGVTYWASYWGITIPKGVR
jgi:hypothetical protein